jgi:D-3-phosphoglycerate dehydrogenase
MKKVLVRDTLAADGIQILKNAPGIEVDVMTNLTRDELKGIIRDYDVLAIRSTTKVRKEIIDHAEKIAVIGRAGVGLDNVDIAAASSTAVISGLFCSHKHRLIFRDV